MPDASIVQVADAVLELLEPIVLAEDGASIERDYVPVRELAEAEALLVSVVIPGIGKAPPEARRARRREYTIDVAVQHRVPLDLADAAARKAWLDGRLLFVESLQNKLEDYALHADGTNAPFPLDAAPVSVDIETVYSPSELDGLRLLAAMIRAVYVTERLQD